MGRSLRTLSSSSRGAASRRAWLFSLGVAGGLLLACGDDVSVGSQDDGGAATSAGGGGGSAGSSASGGGGGALVGGGTSGGASSGGTSSGGSAAGGSAAGGSGGAAACVVTSCQGHTYLCGNCVDDDNDGLVDSEDPDCLGPCDNTEDSYSSGIAGGNEAPCKMDCYFDQDTGNNDGCYWSHRCDPLSVSPNYPPAWSATCAYDAQANIAGTAKSCAELSTAQSAECGSYCGPLTPNGCDCFGCCELPAASGKFVYLGSEVNKQPTCDKDSVGDPTKCHPCTPVPGCYNECGECELCLGKDTLPAHCNPGGGGAGGSGGAASGGSAGQGGSGGSGQCASDVQACGLPGQGPCADSYYCVTGCCVRAPR